VDLGGWEVVADVVVDGPVDGLVYHGRSGVPVSLPA
jgi:hypothetical protein